MKRAILICLALLLAPSFGLGAQNQRIINRYSMRLDPQEDGSYTLDSKTLSVLDGAEPEGLYEPYDRKPVIPSSIIKEVRCEEVFYKAYPDRELNMFIAPAEKAESPVPVVIFIHGGGWSAGNARSFVKYAKYVARYCGFAGVSVEYSMIGQDNVDIDVTMQDLHDAVKYLSDHAKEYNLDVTRLAFAGSSAGGHLSAMMAMTEPCAKVLSGWSGVYDMAPHLDYWKNGKKPHVRKYFFDVEPERIKDYSPVYLIPQDRQVAVQLFHGTGDASVHYSQAERFADALEKAGQKTVECHIYPWYGHGLTGSSDKNKECLDLFVEFLKTHIYE
jgi:acetyl esterase/lipase